MSRTDARVSMLIELADRPGSLEAALHVFRRHGVNLTHIESRPEGDGTFDFYVDCEGSRGDSDVEQVIQEMEDVAEKLMVLDNRRVPWFPRHIAELDLIAGRTLDAGTELNSDHPGFNDPDYRDRRRYLEALAAGDRYGKPFPVAEYTSEEQQTWRVIYQSLRAKHQLYACTAYLNAISALERECGYGPETIPQARDISAFLEARTGFRLRPVAGLLSSRDFLAGLAYRVFFSTQYIRHGSVPDYTPEPDICHELIGHAPMFADPAFADFSQEIGLASLGASDHDVERLARCYWYSVEFGLLREQGKLKAYGAGLLSSAGELVHACASGSPTLRPWDPEDAADLDYPITEYQPLYYVADSLQSAKAQMVAFAEALPRPFHARYNPVTRRIWVDRAIERRDRQGGSD